MEVKKLYKRYLKEIKLMQLATCRDGKPWLCSVWYVMDRDENIYFISRENRKHSLEIKDNEQVACTFVKSFTEGLGEKGQALIVSGIAKKLSYKESAKPFALYAKRYPQIVGLQALEEFVSGKGAHFFYKITPKEIVWFDEVNFPDSPRQKVL